MDIQFAYNLERLLYYASAENASVVRDIMADVEKQYRFQSDANGALLSPDLLSRIHRTFSSVSVSDALTIETIQQVYSSAGVVLCPHSAISVYAGLKPFQHLTEQSKVVCVLTANPVKFASTVKKAIGDESWGRLPYPERIARLERLPERFQWLRKSSETWRDEWISVIKQAVITINTSGHDIS
jgi:threonine synthase